MRRYHRTHFYRYHYNPSPKHGDMENIGGLEFAVFTLPPVMIYGYESDSEYVEDHRIIDDSKERGYIYGNWFSEACVEGEWGSNHISHLVEITEEEFEAARARGWTS